MPKNLDYRSDTDYTFNLHRRVLSIIGIWPYVKRDIGASPVLNILRLICYLLLYFGLIPSLLKMFSTGLPPRKRLKLLGPMCNCMMAISKYTILHVRNNRLSECLRHVEEDWKEVVLGNDRNIMLENAKFGRYLATASIVLVYGSGFSYRVFGFMKGPIVTPQNLTIRPLPIPGHFVFFDVQRTPAYEIVLVLQFLTGFVVYSTMVGACSLTALFTMHICGQLEILIARMRDLVKDNSYETREARRKLAVVVEHQKRVRSFLKNVENMLQYTCLIEVIGCSMIICLLGYYMIIEWEDSDAAAIFTYALLFITFIFNLFIFCYIGQLLLDQGMKVAVTSYTLDWNRLPNKVARCLVLIIAASSLPTKITAGKFMDLSLNSFGSVIRTSVAYLNLLRTMHI